MEQLKRNAYEERVRQVENASFVPLVFTTSGSASPAATVVLKRLAARLAEARDLSYSTVMGWPTLSAELLSSSVCSDVFSRLSIPTHHGPRQCSKPCLLCS